MSKQTRIVVVVGSARRESINRKLADAIARLAPEGVEFTTLRIDDLPMYNQDDDANQAESVKRMKAEVRNADGVLFVTPEYNRSIPALLKNALDHGSRPSGDNAWAGKPGGVIGASPGAIGTAAAQQHLRNVLACLDVAAMAQPEAFIQVKEGFFDADGGVAEGSRKVVQKFVDKLAAWVRAHQG